MPDSCDYIFILAILILSTDQNVARERSLWSVEPISAPIVQASITFDYMVGNRSEKFTDKTRGIFKRLSIPLNSTLWLLCDGYDPIEWTKNGEAISDSTENVLQISILPKNEANGYFRKRLEIAHVTFETAGHYACTAHIPDLNVTIEESLQTGFEVIAEGPAITEQVTEPRILTPMYDEVYRECPNVFWTGFKVIAPLGMDYKEYFVFPGDVTFQPSYRGSNQILPNGVSYSASSPSLSMTNGSWFTSLSLSCPLIENTYQVNGTFTYVVQYKATDGTWLNVSRQVTLIPLKERVVREEPNAEITARDTFRVELLIGRYYTLIYHGDIISGTFEAHGLSSTICDLIHVPAESQYDACGVLDMITMDEKRIEIAFGKVTAVLRHPFRFRLKVLRSCAFQLHIWSTERNQSITKTIYVKAVAEAHKPMIGEDSVAFVSDGTVQDNVEKYINEAITIQCRFPACGWEIIALCKQRIPMDCVRIRRENSTYVSFSTRFGVTLHGQNVSFLQLTNLTFALEIRIDKVDFLYAGVYECGELQSSSYTRDEYYSNEEMAFHDIWRRMHFINFRLAVIQPRQAVIHPPRAPNFVVEQPTSQEITMNNGQAILDCPSTGSPEPSITWTKHIVNKENGSDTVEKREIGAYMNKTSVKVQETGTYECTAKNRFRERSRKFNVEHETPSPLPVALSAVVFLTFAVAAAMWQRRRAKKALFRKLAQLLSEPSGGIQLDDVLPLNDQTDILNYNTNFEIDRDRFQLIKVIGDGEFGQIYRGELLINENQRRYVAVKVPKNPLKPEHHQALISELKIMIYLRPHVNVLALVGACTNELEQRQRLFVLTEYCEKGSLLSYLQEHILDYESDAPGFGLQSLLDFVYQAANGMEHLATWRIIHRDLAVRNLLVTRRGVIKIADFGLSRKKETVYSYNKFLLRNVRLPVAWMAPESVTRFEYTHKSDVWSFGIVLWEIFSCGRVPYSNEDITGMDIIPWLRAGNRLSMPALATNEMFSLMIDCWGSDPANRPTFSQCKSRIARHLEDKFPSNYTSLLLLLSDSFCQMGAVWQAPSTALSQEIPIDPFADQLEEQRGPPVSLENATNVGTREAGGEINTAFEDEEPANGYVTGGDNAVSEHTILDEELPGQQGAHEDSPLLA